MLINRVLALLDDRGMSVNQLAGVAGVSQGSLSLVLRGEKCPTLRTLDHLARALEVRPWELLRDPACDPDEDPDPVTLDGT